MGNSLPRELRLAKSQMTRGMLLLQLFFVRLSLIRSVQELVLRLLLTKLRLPQLRRKNRVIDDDHNSIWVCGYTRCIISAIVAYRPYLASLNVLRTSLISMIKP